MVTHTQAEALQVVLAAARVQLISLEAEYDRTDESGLYAQVETLREAIAEVERTIGPGLCRFTASHS